jgi:hypothetical protein
MTSFFKHLGLFLGGAACIVAGVFVPPAAAFLGPIGTKLIIAAGAVALTGASPEVLTGAIKGAAQSAANKP